MTTATVLERGIFVDGAVEPVAAPMLTIANPGTGETVGRATRADAVAVDRAVRSAHAAFADWSRRGYADRGAILRAGADALLARVDELVPGLVAEQGKTVREARIELRKAADTLEHYADRRARDGAGGLRHQAGDARARRLGPDDHLRRRRPGEGGQRGVDGPLLQLRPGVPGDQARLRARAGRRRGHRGDRRQGVAAAHRHRDRRGRAAGADALRAPARAHGGPDRAHAAAWRRAGRRRRPPGRRAPRARVVPRADDRRRPAPRFGDGPGGGLRPRPADLARQGL